MADALRDLVTEMCRLARESVEERRWETDTSHADEAWWRGYLAALEDVAHVDG